MIVTMGTQGSKEERFGHSTFSDYENKHLEHVLFRIAGDGKWTFSDNHLQIFLSSTFLAEFAGQLFMYMKKVQSATTEKHSRNAGQSSKEVDCTGFITTIVHTFRGNVDDVACLLASVAGLQDDSVMLANLWKLVLQLVKVCLSDSVWTVSSEKSLNAFVRNLLHSLIHKGQRPQCDVTDPVPMTNNYSVADIEVWLSQSPLFRDIVRCSFAQCFLMNEVLRLPSLIPVCEPIRRGMSLVAEKSAILDLAGITFLNHHLPYDLRGVFRPMFSSIQQGESFSALLRSIINQGPNVIIVEDTDGYIFGGFASESWTARPQFYGSASCFLFTIFPVMEIYVPSGLNTNYMYLNQNQQTLPNGLGFGGQFEYFGFWLDQQYGIGHSKAQPKCTTYKSPQLSAKPSFSIRTLEVWAVGAGKEDPTDDSADKEKRSILDKADAGTKAILEMVGKGRVSDGVRESDNN